MKPQGLMRPRVCRNLLKVGTALLFLAVFIFILQHMDLLEMMLKENSAINLKEESTDPPMLHDFCTLKSLSPADALEERLLLDSIAWPETPLWPDPLSLEQTSAPANSTFTILPGRRGRGEWHEGDQLEVLIKMYNFLGHAKKSGGDVLLARLHNKALSTGVAGRVVDHLNGSYSAVFPLLWEGSAQVEVIFVHSSEAVTVLRRLTREEPDRILFESLFRSGSISQHTICNVCLHQTSQPLCNYTDLRTGEPWFCYKPLNLSCDARISHMKGKFNQKLKAKEEELFERNVNMKVFITASGADSVTVLPQRKEQPGINKGNGTSELSGYYYLGEWRTLGGTRVHQFNTSSAISQCLKGKEVHLYGDSTVRQWYEYLGASLPDAKEVNLNSPKQAGPLMMVDFANSFLVTYRCHGPPLRFQSIPISRLRYIANELDRLTGGTNTIVVIGIWSHFSTFPVELYIRRLQNIRKAVIRLLNRAPGTLVVIRTANPKALTLYETLTNSDWYSLQRDKVLRAVFRGVNVKLVDAWEMVLAHDLPHSLHPQPPIIKNMINVLMSYICPKWEAGRAVQGLAKRLTVAGKRQLIPHFGPG